MQHDLELNKLNAIAFYRTAYLGDPAGAVRAYVGAEYRQHNPLVADGKQAFIDYFEEMARDYPDKNIEFVRTIAEGDLVALHTLQTWPENEQYVTMDFSASMMVARLSNTGILYRQYRLKQRMVIPCTKGFTTANVSNRGLYNAAKLQPILRHSDGAGSLVVMLKYQRITRCDRTESLCGAMPVSTAANLYDGLHSSVCYSR